MFTGVRQIYLALFLIAFFGATFLHAQTPPASEPTWQELLAKAETLYASAQYDSALRVAKHALEIAETSLGKEDTLVASILNGIGAILYSQARFGDAEQVWKRALDIGEKTWGLQHRNVATTLNNLAAIYCEQSNYADAEPLYERVLQIREETLGPDHPDVGSTLNDLANLMKFQGRYAESEPLYMRALQIKENALGLEHTDVASSLDNLGLLYDEEGRYAEAELLCKRALKIYEKVSGPEHPDVAMSLNNLAIVYADQSLYAEAEPLQKRALQIWEEVLGPDHPDVAIGLHNLAIVYAHHGLYAEAEPIQKRALQIREKALGPEHPDVATSLNSLANLYADQGRYAEAEPLRKRALQILETALGPGHPDVAMTLYNLGNLYRSQGSPAEAEPLYQRALRIYEIALCAQHPNLAVCLSGMSSLRKDRGAFGEAMELQLRAWNIRRENLRDNGTVLAERNALEYSQFLTQETAHYLSILLDAPGSQTANSDRIAQVVFSSKGQVSDVILARNRALVSETDSTTLRLADTLRYARFALSKLYVDGPGEDSVAVHRNKLDKAVAEKERLEAELARRSVSFQRDQELWEVDALKVEAALPSGGTMVEFMKYDHRTGVKSSDVEPRYLALVIGSGGALSVFPLGAAAPIDTAVYWYRQQFASASDIDALEYNAVSEGVYSRVWRPFAGLLKNASTVYIAPDGNLNLVSFAGLKDDDGKYLIEDYPIHYLSSGRDLIRLQDQSSPGAGMLAMGDPDYDLSFQKGSMISSTIANTNFPGLISFRNVRSGCQALKDLKVARLPQTRTEVDAVSGQWTKARSDSVVSYFGEDATEENFKQSAPGKQVIHLATHGYYISEECQRKQVARGLSGESEGYVGENPLLLSGFLLAGANHHTDADDANREDGIVTAEDVAGLNLRGTDLVVLSACESGLGTVKSGEGVYGLRRAFQMAGVRTVISALWPIDDKSTAAFMGQLISTKDETMPQTMRRIALNRLSSLRAQGKFDHPFYWAGFVATGSWKTL